MRAELHELGKLEHSAEAEPLFKAIALVVADFGQHD
jgi:hypothetical protein